MANDIMRLAGINSGYDSEAMIEKMMQTYQTKIDNQNKKLTKLTWQQEAYRDITSKLTTFKNKYFDILNKSTYLMSPTSFSKFKTTITNKADPTKTSGLRVITSSDSVEGTHKVNVSRIATATTRTGAVIGTSNFNLDVEKALNTSESKTNAEDATKNDYSFALDVKVGNVSKTLEFSVTVPKDMTDDDIAQARTDIIDKMNEQFKEYFGEIDKDSGNYFIQAKANDDGTIGFDVKGNSAVSITEKTGNFGLAKLSSRVAIAAQAAVTGENSIAVNVNGTVHEVKFNAVSDTYYDSRSLKGNESILMEYNQLKEEAFVEEYGRTPTAQELENFTYTSTQAAKDKNTAAIQTAMNAAFKDEGIRFTFKDSYVTAWKGREQLDLSLTATSGGTFGLQKGGASNKFSDKTELSSLGIKPDDEGNYKLKINGKEISVGKNATIADLVSEVNKSGAGVTMTYSKLENKFIIKSNDLGNGGDVDIDEDSEFAKALGLTESAGADYTLGENAKFVIDGVELYHNSNTYEMDGITFDLSESELNTDITVGVAKDYTDVKQTIKDFVKDYNQLIDDIYSYVGTAPQRDSKNNKYEPLTDAQKEEMSEKEIENWETAAKKGLLYNDSTVLSVLSKMRVSIYNSVKLDDGSNFGLYNMGIKVASALTDSDGARRGKLELDEDAFDKAFEENPEAVTKLFTDPNNGIMKKLNDSIDDAVSTRRIANTNTIRGTLIRKAGLESGTTAKDNTIYRQMEQITKRIQTLQKRYDSKEDYWWKVFTNLEKMMSSMNSQSSYLANYLGNFGSQQ